MNMFIWNRNSHGNSQRNNSKKPFPKTIKRYINVSFLRLTELGDYQQKIRFYPNIARFSFLRKFHNQRISTLHFCCIWFIIEILLSNFIAIFEESIKKKSKYTGNNFFKLLKKLFLHTKFRFQ